jgi:hypothetical protein
MNRPVNIASTTSHSQALEAAREFGASVSVGAASDNGALIEANARIEALTTANTEGAATVADLNGKVAALEATLAAEVEAHSKTNAALQAALNTK